MRAASQTARSPRASGVNEGGAPLPSACGLLLEGGAALVAGRWIAPLLFKESPRDPPVFATVIGLLFVVSLVASAVPARRAARVDPNEALRAD